MAVDQELSALATVASLLPTDIIYLVRDPGGVAEADNKAAVSVMDARFATAAQGVLADSALQAAAIGVTVQAYDAGLASIAGLTTAADRMIYTTALDVYAVTPITAFGRSLIDDADAATARATLVAAGTGVANTFSQINTFSLGLAISDGRVDLTRNLTGNTQQGMLANVRPSTFQSGRAVDAALSLLNGHTNSQAFITAPIALIGRILMTATSSITNAILVGTDAQIPTNTTITNLYHIAPRNPTIITGTLTNQWGLNIPDMTAATTLNYAIQTGLGLVVFGDQTRVKQPSTTAAVPTLFLEQLDLSEEFVEFNGTVATGNPIEAVGAKTLTTTHFLRVSVNGSFVYIPCGTIA